jgi:hypothetical protein
MDIKIDGLEIRDYGSCIGKPDGRSATGTNREISWASPKEGVHSKNYYQV